MFDSMVGDGDGLVCRSCNKPITVHQRTNLLVMECKNCGWSAVMDKRGYCTWRCGCAQGYYSETKQEWSENTDQRWKNKPPAIPKRRAFYDIGGKAVDGMVSIGELVGSKLGDKLVEIKKQEEAKKRATKMETPAVQKEG